MISRKSLARNGFTARQLLGLRRWNQLNNFLQSIWYILQLKPKFNSPKYIKVFFQIILLYFIWLYFRTALISIISHVNTGDILERPLWALCFLFIWINDFNNNNNSCILQIKPQLNISDGIMCTLLNIQLHNYNNRHVL